MASISKRGPHQFQVQIRRKGYPAKQLTFESRREAEGWAATVESEMLPQRVGRSVRGYGRPFWQEVLTAGPLPHWAERSKRASAVSRSMTATRPWRTHSVRTPRGENVLRD